MDNFHKGIEMLKTYPVNFDEDLELWRQELCDNYEVINRCLERLQKQIDETIMRYLLGYYG